MEEQTEAGGGWAGLAPRALDHGILGEDEGEGPLHRVVEGEGIKARRLLGALRRRHRGGRGARRVDDAEQLLGEVVREQVA